MGPLVHLPFPSAIISEIYKVPWYRYYSEFPHRHQGCRCLELLAFLRLWKKQQLATTHPKPSLSPLSCSLPQQPCKILSSPDSCELGLTLNEELYKVGVIQTA